MAGENQGELLTRRGFCKKAAIEVGKTLGGIALGFGLKELVDRFEQKGQLEILPAPKGKVEVKTTGSQGEVVEFLMEHEALANPNLKREVEVSAQIDT